MTFIVCQDTNDEAEQMGRSDKEAEVLLLSNEMQNPNVRDAAAAISTRIPLFLISTFILLI